MRTVTKLKPARMALPQVNRVAGYARVSSAKGAMLHSLAAQVSHYSGYIQQRPGWVYAGVYADEAHTGTRDDRPALARLLRDCRAGKIDMIITKSIARFARNTVHLLEIVRELKALGIDVYFENNNIHSLSEDGELMLTILASFAQEESRSVSENCKWRIRRQFEKGELAGFRFMFGYRVSKAGVSIHAKEADAVRMIFDDYINGMGGDLIARKLRGMRIPALHGGTWSGERVLALIRNEKYTGNALLQKKYVIDHLEKKLVWNKGELPQYFAEDTHPAIISVETFEMAQEVMEQRRRHFKNAKGTTPSRYPFTSKIVCGECGKHYKRKNTAGKASWQCTTFLQEGKAACPAKQIPEDTLERVTAMILGLEAFDAQTFHDRIAEIRVPCANHLIFAFHDGHSALKIWQDRSRRESWDDSMRQIARERQLEINRRNRL